MPRCRHRLADFYTSKKFTLLESLGVAWLRNNIRQVDMRTFMVARVFRSLSIEKIFYLLFFVYILVQLS